MTTNTENSPRLIGLVKWFNKKSGYGFITVYEGELKGKDIFVHYSSIRVSNSHYKYLVQGEYIEFILDKSIMENHEYQATDISGVKEGPIMCDTVYKNMESSNSNDARKYRPTTDTDRPSDNDGDFIQVAKKNRPRAKSYSSIVQKNILEV
jgi:cold shock CspA family protein